MTETDRREFLKSTGAAIAGATGIGVLTSASAQDEIEKKRILKRAELAERLQKLADSKPPKNLSPGATCYSIIGPITKEQPCSVCERTMGAGEKDEILRSYNVPLKRIQEQGVDAALILPEHCPACGFGLGRGKIFVEIRYPDHPVPVRVEPQKPHEFLVMLGGASELEIMALFLQGKDRYLAGQGREEALKDKVERLRELFGVAEKKEPEKK